MPKKVKGLSALAVAKLKTAGRYTLGGADGLHLRIAGGGQRMGVARSGRNPPER